MTNMPKTALLLALACAIVPLPSAAQQADQAQQVLQQARAAAGGDKLAALQSLTVEGKSRRQIRMGRGPDAQVMTRESEFQMDFLMPDKYVRRETTEAMGGYITATNGFNGSDLIQQMESSMEMPQGMRMNMGQPDPAVIVKRQQTEAARFWLAWTFAAPGYAQLQFRHAGAKGGADIIEVTGGDMPPMQLSFDPQSHRLTTMRYKAPAPPQRIMMGGPGGGGPPPGATPPPPAGPPEEIEVEVTYSDFKAVDGVMLPHRIRRSTNGEVTEETEIKKFKLNPNLKADKFKPRSPSN